MSEEILDEEVIQYETNRAGNEVQTLRFDRFLRGRTYYAWLEITAAQMATTIPEGAKWGSTPVEPPEQDEDGNPITRQKTVTEFVLSAQWNLSGTKAIISLAAMERPVTRTKRVTKTDVEDWEFFAEMVWGIALDQWLDHDQRVALVQSADYTEPGGA